MSAPDLEFRWTMGVSALVHATLLVLIWVSAAAHAVEPEKHRLLPDAWMGTTVSVVEQPREPVVPQQQESSPSDGQALAPARGQPRQVKPTERDAVPEPRKIRVITPLQKGGDTPLSAAAPRPGLDADRARNPAARDVSTGAAGIDLKQAMQNSINQPTLDSGSFGAAGVDLTERRLPKAFTRALPVAIGAEPGWWKQHLGSLGSVQFTVALTENGKLDEVTIDDETKHPFHARVVRRVAKLLAMGTFALPTSTTGSATQAFELRLVMEQLSADTNSTADPGDLVEKGFEAPTTTKPGQAIIRDAPGHTLRAFLKIMPARRAATHGDGSLTE